MQLRKLIQSVILESGGQITGTNPLKTRDLEVGTNEKWEPLYRFLEPIFGDKYVAAADGFMFMNARSIESEPKKGMVLFWYKHGITRKYVVLDQEGNPYELEMTGDDFDEVANLRPQSNEAAYQKVYGSIEKFIKDNPNSESIPDGVLSDYKAYKQWRDKFAAANGYNVNTVTKDDLNEAKTREQKLKDNKVKLTDEERAEIITKGATWRDGKPGIWKSVDKNGNIHYCSNTHRAMAVSTTLKAAIKKFPFIKSTA